jgi:hypothetical protein
MSYAEENRDDWREIRERADSIANAVIILDGGTLSLSITVILGNKDSGIITPKVRLPGESDHKPSACL